MCTRPNMVSVRGHVIPCSCGKCAECVTKRQSAFGIRGTEEMRNWKTTVFVTLTLDDDHIRYKKLGDLLDDCSASKRLSFDKSFYKRNGRFPLDSEYPAEVFDTDSNIEKCAELLDKRPQKDFSRYQRGYDFMHSERLNRDTLVAVPDKAEFSLFMKRLRQNIVNSLFPRHMNAENETRKTDAFVQTSEVERQLKRSEIHLNEKQEQLMEAQIVDYNSKVDARTQEVALKWYLANLEEDKFEFSKFKYNDTERPKSMAEIANLEAQAALSSAYEELAKTEAWAKANEVERENMLAENATRRLNHDMEMEDKRFAQDVAEWQQGVKDAKKQRIWNGVTSLVGSAASVFSGVAGVAGTLISSSAKRYATDRQFASDMIQATDRIRTKRTYEGRYDSKGQWHRTSGSYSTYD